MRFFIAILLTNILLVQPLFADQIKEVQIDASGATKLSSNRPNPYSIEVFKHKQNLFNVFTSIDKFLPEDWLGIIKSDGFRPLGKFSTRKETYYQSFREYATKSGSKITLTIVVMHPRAEPSYISGLIEEFTILQPPTLKIKSAQELEIDGKKAFLYEKENGGCSLLINATYGAVVNLAMKSCEHSDEMLTLANLFNLERLAKKLNS